MLHFQMRVICLKPLTAHFYLYVDQAIRQSKIPPSGRLNEVITGINRSR